MASTMRPIDELLAALSETEARISRGRSLALKLQSELIGLPPGPDRRKAIRPIQVVTETVRFHEELAAGLREEQELLNRRLIR